SPTMISDKGDEYLVYGIAITFLYVIWKGFSNFFSPIRHLHLPGPILAQFTNKWLLMHDLAGHRAERVHSLYKQYGPIVQVAPNEISLANIACIKDIYGGSTTCLKAPMYSTIGKMGLFQMQDPEQYHTRHRRIGIIMNVVERKTDKVFNALHWMRITALNIAGEVLLGKSFDLLKGEKPPAYIHHLDNVYLVHALWDLASIVNNK
ncbi:hypothetical protein AOQ84DRAFT_369814, partial [Glonium stellatum]